MTLRIGEPTLVEKDDGWYVEVRTSDGIGSAGPTSKATAEQMQREILAQMDECPGDAEEATPTKDEAVDEILTPWRKMISNTPELLSLLYDIDMMPEQCVTRAGAIKLVGLCLVWQRIDKVRAQAIEDCAERAEGNWFEQYATIGEAIRALSASPKATP